MTEGYPAQWQQDVQLNEAAPAFADGRHEATAAPVYDQAAPSAPVYDQAPVSDSAASADSGDQGKAGAAKEQAAAVGQGAAEAGAQVASVAKDQASSVVAEAGSQAKDLLGQARSELTEQAGSQQKRLVETLRSLGSELESMGHHSDEPGMATDLVKQASGRAHDAASWLDGREPGSLFSELQSFARQRPGAFLALAAGAGLVVGRLGRGVKDATSDDAPSAPSAASDAGYAPTTYVDTTPAVGGGYAAPDAPRPFASSQDAGYESYPTYPSEGGL